MHQCLAAVSFLYSVRNISATGYTYRLYTQSVDSAQMVDTAVEIAGPGVAVADQSGNTVVVGASGQ